MSTRLSWALSQTGIATVTTWQLVAVRGPMKILLVEDDAPLGRSLLQVLRDQGHATVWLRELADARLHLSADSFDLLLLDIMLPDGSGLDLLCELRARRLAVPVMMLTARDAVADRVAGLDGGADDYLAKPFAIDELLSRVRALQRRSRGQLSAIWAVGDLSIDTARRRVFVSQVEVALSAREYDILAALATEPGKVMTRRDLERGSLLVDTAESNTLDVQIYNLRKKLGGQRIGTVRGVGYVLERT
jgi:DNA-binding response OmpR family regulator